MRAQGRASVRRGVDAWAVPDWTYAKEDGTFGNRFDDRMGVYRALYASSQRLGCFIEALARFRVDVSFVADLALMENGEHDFTAFGTVSRSLGGAPAHFSVAGHEGDGFNLRIARTVMLLDIHYANRAFYADDGHE